MLMDFMKRRSDTYTGGSHLSCNVGNQSGVMYTLDINVTTRQSFIRMQLVYQQQDNAAHLQVISQPGEQLDHTVRHVHGLDCLSRRRPAVSVTTLRSAPLPSDRCFQSNDSLYPCRQEMQH